MLDPNETKCGKYGVLSLRSPPSSPRADSILQSDEKSDQVLNDVSDENDTWKTSCESVNTALPVGSGTKYRVQEVVVRMRGTAYTKHIQWWSGIKRKSIFC